MALSNAERNALKAKEIAGTITDDEQRKLNADVQTSTTSRASRLRSWAASKSNPRRTMGASPPAKGVSTARSRAEDKRAKSEGDY